MPPTSIDGQCRQAIAVARRGDPQAGLILARVALQAARAAALPDARCRAMNTLAACQAIQGAFIESVATSLDAYRMAGEHRFRVRAIEALVTLVGAAGFIVDTPADALAVMDHCLAEAMACGGGALERRVHFVRGVVYFGLGRWDEAETEYHRALMLADDGEVPASLIHGNLAHVSVRRALIETGEARAHRWHEAERRIAAVQSMLGEEGNPDGEARAWLNLGSLRLQQERYAEAQEALEKSLALSEATRHSARAIDVLIRLGTLYLACSRPERALTSFIEAYRRAELARPTPSIAKALECLANVYDHDGKAALAAQHRTLAAREHREYRQASEKMRIELKRLWQTL